MLLQCAYNAACCLFLGFFVVVLFCFYVFFVPRYVSVLLSVGAYGNRFVCVCVCVSVRALASTLSICEVKARYF